MKRFLARATVAALKSRAEHLPGAPDDRHVVLQYDTVCEGKSSATETITPMLDEDGAWRRSGYFR